MNKPTKIKDLKELQELSTDKNLEVFINFGFARSSKSVYYNSSTKKWEIINEIDDSEQELATEELKNNTNIIEALDKGALYKYNY